MFSPDTVLKNTLSDISTDNKEPVLGKLMHYGHTTYCNIKQQRQLLFHARTSGISALTLVATSPRWLIWIQWAAIDSCLEAWQEQADDLFVCYILSPSLTHPLIAECRCHVWLLPSNHRVSDRIYSTCSECKPSLLMSLNLAHTPLCLTGSRNGGRLLIIYLLNDEI